MLALFPASLLRSVLVVLPPPSPPLLFYVGLRLTPPYSSRRHYIPSSPVSTLILPPPPPRVQQASSVLLCAAGQCSVLVLAPPRRDVEENRGEAAPERQQGEAEGHEGCLGDHRHRRDIRGHGVAQDDGDRHGGPRERGEQAAQGLVVGDHRVGRPGQGAREERRRGEEGRRRQEERRRRQEQGRRRGQEGRRRGEEEGRRGRGQEEGRRREEGGAAADGAADPRRADEPVPGVLLPVPAHGHPATTLLRAEHGGEPQQLLHHLLNHSWSWLLHALHEVISKCVKPDY